MLINYIGNHHGMIVKPVSHIREISRLNVPKYDKMRVSLRLSDLK